MITLRDYRSTDEAACIDVFDSNLPKFFTLPERGLFVAFLARPPELYAVAEEDGIVVGCGGYRVDDFGVAYFAWGMVHAARHRTGVGSRLVAHRLEAIRRVPHAWCALLDTSQHTAPFYAKMGFTAYRTIPDGYQPGLDKIYMRCVWA